MVCSTLYGLLILLTMCGDLRVDISTVDILKESKGVTLEDIKQDLQREISSDAFAYYRDQVKLAAEANAERRASRPSSPRRESHTQQGSNQTPSRSRRKSHIQQDSDQIPPRSRSRSRDRKHSPSSNGERDGNATKGAYILPIHRAVLWHSYEQILLL